jgi:hypothetical protein
VATPPLLKKNSLISKMKKKDKKPKKINYYFLISIFLFLIIATSIFFITLQDKDEDYKKLFWHNKTSKEYWLKPNLDEKYENFTVKTNSQGFRDKEFTADKESYRIIALGGVDTFGWKQKEENVYVSIVEKVLDKNFKDEFEIYNMATPGHGVKESLNLLEKVDKYNPDLLILPIRMSDFFVNPDKNMLLGFENVVSKNNNSNKIFQINPKKEIDITNIGKIREHFEKKDVRTVFAFIDDLGKPELYEETLYTVGDNRNILIRIDSINKTHFKNGLLNKKGHKEVSKNVLRNLWSIGVIKTPDYQMLTNQVETI